MIIDKFDELFGKISKRDLKIQKLKQSNKMLFMKAQELQKQINEIEEKLKISEKACEHL